MDKPTSKSSRTLNYFVVIIIMIVWTFVSLSRKDIAPLDISLVALIAVCLFGRAGIELVQAVGPNVRIGK